MCTGDEMCACVPAFVEDDIRKLVMASICHFAANWVEAA